MEIFVILIVICALLSLLWMGWIDLKLWILPNELVATFALLALPFHFGISWIYGDWIFGGWLSFVFGGIVGGGTLWVIRALANRFYGMETMGMGDVKLLGAAGLWLGPQNILIAMSVGAFCGVLHALILAIIQGQSISKTTNLRPHWPRFLVGVILISRSMRRMMLPAGPGFIAGIIGTSLWIYKDLLL